MKGDKKRMYMEFSFKQSDVIVQEFKTGLTWSYIEDIGSDNVDEIQELITGDKATLKSAIADNGMGFGVMVFKYDHKLIVDGQ